MMVSSIAFLWQPQWTTQVRIESGGRYPLGLNRFHDGLEDFLIKGVIGAADRLRYVTYCCWAIGDIEICETCVDYAEFVNAFIRRENALALGLYMMQPAYGIYGSDAMSKIVKEGIEEYDCTFRLMQSKDLGAYGLYYAGTIYNWGLTETDEKGFIRLTQAGKEIYKIIDQHFKREQPEYYKKYKGKKNVPAKVLLQWAQINDFDNIRLPAHKKEREFYKSVLFRFDKKRAADYRRDSFALVMECIKNCSNTNTAFDEDVLRNIHYYSSYFDDNGTAHKFSVQKHFNDVHFYWAVYEGHVYFRWWLSKYFEVFLNHLKSCDNGSTIDEFLAEADPGNFNATFKSFCGKRKDFFNTPMETIFGLFSESSSLQDSISEESVTNDEEYETPSDVLAKFVLIMAGLYVKFKNIRSDKRYKFLVGHLSEDLWFEALFRFNNLEHMPVCEFLKTVLKRQIINQHDLIMIEKNDLRRCWFTTENKRNFHQSDVSLIWRPAKFQTIMNFLSDMKLITNEDSIVKLSGEGRTSFQNIMRDFY